MKTMHTEYSTQSVWQATENFQKAESLLHDEVTDVCIVGAGIAGLSTAYELCRRGRSVVVLEAGEIGGGETALTSGHLSSALDDQYSEIERIHGEEWAKLAAESHQFAIKEVAAIVEREKIDCDFEWVDGYLFGRHTQSPSSLEDELMNELRAVRKTGVIDVEAVNRAPIPTFNTGPALRFKDQAQFHPLKYLNGLYRAILATGHCRVFSLSRVVKVEDGVTPVVVTESGFHVKANSLVICTNTPVHPQMAIHTKQTAYRSYVIGARVPRGTVPHALFWDTEKPYHYVRVVKDDIDAKSDILLIGGEDHKVGDQGSQDARIGQLERWAVERFPEIHSFRFRWSGQVIEPVDFLAFIGPAPGSHPHVYVVTGDSGHGLTHGVIAGALISDLIEGETQHAWAKIYAPSRKSLKTAGHFARENLNVASCYGEWLKDAGDSRVDSLEAGEGRIVQRGLKKLAVCRDGDGTLHALSAICPHLGCVVHWNSFERSWDCPCHGSRFSAKGTVVHGPAVQDLSPEDLEETGLFPLTLKEGASPSERIIPAGSGAV